MWAAAAAVAVVGSSLADVSSGAPAAAADADSGPTAGVVVAAAEELPGPVERVELADGVVVVQAGGQVMWRAADDAGGAWSSTWGGLPLTGELVDAEGDVVLTRVGAGGPGTLAWASDGGGSREVPAGTVLGRGGRYVAYPAGAAGAGWRVEPVAGGSGTVLAASNGPVALWEGQAAVAWGDTSEVSSNDARDGAVTRQLGKACWRADGTYAVPRLADRTARWVLASCDGVPVVLDDGGDLPAPVYQWIQAGPGGFDPDRLQVGEGVVVGFSGGVLTAQPVLAGTPTRFTGSVAFDLADDGRTLAHVDADGDVRVVDLAPVASAMSTTVTDTTRPRVSPPTFTADGVAFAGASPSETYTVRARGYDDVDPYALYRSSGLAGVELRHGPGTTGPWTSAGSGSVTVTFPAGSERCWQAQATDNAGNVSSWTEPACVRVDDGSGPVLQPGTLPSVVKGQTTGTTAVRYTYGASDRLGVASYDVRHRVTPAGQPTAAWVYPSTHQGTTATSVTVSVPKSTVTCFSARARDRAGNVSSWSAARCAYVDGTAPRVVRTSLTGPYLPVKTQGVIAWRPDYVVSATDDRGPLAYQKQRRWTREGSTRTRSTTDGWTSARELSDYLGSGDQSCWRARARDGVGHIGAWSGWRCTQAPVAALWGWDHSRSRVTDLGGTQVVVASKTSKPRPQTDEKYVAKRVRLKVRTGPNEGRAQVYVGERYLGTVSGRSSSVGWKWVTVSDPSAGAGPVRLVALTTAPTRVSTFYAMYWTP